MRAAGRVLAAAALLCALSGCSLLGGLRREDIVKHPDAPMLVAEHRRGHVRVHIYSKGDTSLIEYGWVPVDDLVGWTILKYDWEARIARDKDADDDDPE